MKYVDLLGKDYEPGGCGPDKFDCYHLGREILNRQGYNLPKFEVENDELSMLKMIISGNISSVVEEIDHPEEGCFVTFWIRPPYTTHMGLVIKEPDGFWFIHILRKSRVSKEKLDHPLWKKRITGYYRVKDEYKNRRT